MEELVLALKCASTTGMCSCRKDGCPYYEKEVVPEYLYEVVGSDIWETCNTDKMMFDAARKLEELEV